MGGGGNLIKPRVGQALETLIVDLLQYPNIVRLISNQRGKLINNEILDYMRGIISIFSYPPLPALTSRYWSLISGGVLYVIGRCKWLVHKKEYEIVQSKKIPKNKNEADFIFFALFKDI